jgi:hypothetical protein
LKCLIINCSVFLHHESHFWHQFVRTGGSIHDSAHYS